MELNAEQAINELETQTKYAKFIESKGVLLSAKCAQFALDNIKDYEQRIKELAVELEAMRGAANSYKMHNKKLTEENERLSADKDYWKSRAKESESQYDQAVKRGYELGAVDYVKSFAEMLTSFFANDDNLKYNEVDAEYINECIDRIAKEMLEGEK